MCEIIGFKSDTAIALSEVYEHAALLEDYGVAGFGWGVSWVADGDLHRYRSTGNLRKEQDLFMTKLGDVRTKVCLVHLRRPTFLTTIAMENTQPFLADHDFAFVHNGFLADAQSIRKELEADLKGTIDSEVGFLLYRNYVQTMSTADALEKMVQESIGEKGLANIVVLNRDGTMFAHAQNHRNHMYQFSGKGWTGITTEATSPDGFAFQQLFPWMSDLKLISGFASL